MSILKRLNKTDKRGDIRKASQVIANINKLIEMKLLSVDLSTRKFSIEPMLFAEKDGKFKSNWCRAVAVYWDASTAQDSKNETFIIWNLESESQIGVFTYAEGFSSFGN